MQAQAISLRVASGSGADGLWSSPLSASLTGGAVRHLAIPYREAWPAEGEAHLHGPRVHRALQQSLGCEATPPLTPCTQHFKNLGGVVMPRATPCSLIKSSNPGRCLVGMVQCHRLLHTHNNHI